MQNFRWETPDLAPNEFNLFAALKENLSGCRFNCDEDVRHAACHVAEATRTYVVCVWNGQNYRML
jgi:hypothetical protein